MRMIAAALAVFCAGFLIALAASPLIDRRIALNKGFFELANGTRVSFAGDPPVSIGGIFSWFSLGSSEQPETINLDRIRVTERDKRCKINRVPAGANVALVHIYAGSGTSPVQLLDGLDGLTSRVDVKVGSFGAPVYLVLSAQKSVLWNLIVSQEASIAGLLVLGSDDQAVANAPSTLRPQIIASNKLTGTKCPHFTTYLRQGKGKLEFERMLEEHIGRVPDEEIVLETTGEVVLGAVPPSGFRKLPIDGSKIFTHSRMAVGSTAPRELAFKELLDQGKIAALSVDEFRAMVSVEAQVQALSRRQLSELEEQLLTATPPYYLVKEAFEVPHGMYGAHSVTFVIPGKLPKPKDPGSHNRYVRLGLAFE